MTQGHRRNYTTLTDVTYCRASDNGKPCPIQLRSVQMPVGGRAPVQLPWCILLFKNVLWV